MRTPAFLTAVLGAMVLATVANAATDPATQQQNAAKQQAAASQAQPAKGQQPTQQQQATQSQQAMQQQQAAKGVSPAGMPKTVSGPIHQEVDFTASPARVYEALLNSGQFTAFSGRPATIDRAVGGACSLFSGHIVARNLELVPDKRIVQAWRVTTWPDGVWSIARFELRPSGAGTHLVFDHTGFPEDQRAHLSSGWDTNYWSLMKKYLK